MTKEELDNLVFNVLEPLVKPLERLGNIGADQMARYLEKFIYLYKTDDDCMFPVRWDEVLKDE